MSSITKICSIDGCKNPHSAKSYCTTHLSRLYKYGSPHITKYELHGMSENSIYIAWQSMKNRVTHKNHAQYKNYGGRGIKVCNGWFNSFLSFYKDMGEKPKNYSLDRINNDGNYSCGHCIECIKNGWPFNCRWASRSDQQKNKRVHKNLGDSF